MKAISTIPIAPGVEIGSDRLLLVAGPCVLETKDIAFAVARRLLELSETPGISVVFKSSYAKANRTSVSSYSGPGIDEGLKMLSDVKREFGLPILTDIHNPPEAAVAAEVADILQIPAFLCRQTELVVAAAKTGKPINIKKGQFMSPEAMGEIARKAASVGNDKVILTERGTTFGYGDLVVDFRSLIIMRQLGYPVMFDATHSLQKPGALGDASGGRPEFIIPMTRAAVAVGVDGIYCETHPDPSTALSDAASMLPLEKLEGLVRETLRITTSG